MVTYTTARTDNELRQILDLQQCNLSINLSPGEAAQQGFLSLAHSLDLLKKICGKYRHVIAKHDNRVCGYALVMLREAREEIPLLVPMFEQIDALGCNGRALTDIDYFVMGQICIDKEYRGKGLFKGLYAKLREEMKIDFELVVTEVASRNIRSMQAHEAAGFKRLKQYRSPENELWEIISWDWR